MSSGNRLTVYDILRPIYYCSFPIGFTQFNIKEKRFTSSIWILVWNFVFLIASTSPGIFTLITRGFRGRATAMYTITDLMQGWVNTINVIIIIIFGCIFKNKVLSFSLVLVKTCILF